MLTPKQIKIFETFLRRPYKELTYKEIKEQEKSNSLTQRALIKFLAKDLVMKRTMGNIMLYSVNLKNNTVFSYFDIVIKEKMSSLVKKTLSIILEEISTIEFACLVIFGSYAEGKSGAKSDLDIALFVQSQEDKKNGELAMRSAQLKSIMELDTHVFTKEEMLQMLKDKHENLGKQIAHKHLVVQNPSIFYSIVQGGINNGFKIVYT